MSAPETLTVVVEREFPHPPDKLWRALTEPHLIAESLWENDFAPVVGRRFNIHVNPKPGPNMIVDCEVLEIEPNETLSYTWNLRGTAGGTASTVTFTLTPTGTGTRLRMEQTGFSRDRPQNYGGARAGWTRFLANLDNVLVRME